MVTMIDESVDRVTAQEAKNLGISDRELPRIVTKSGKYTRWFLIKGQLSWLRFVYCARCDGFYRVEASPDYLPPAYERVPDCPLLSCTVEECADLLRGDL